MVSHPHQKGFALLEVLIALLVLSFGLLGIAGLLLVTMKANTSSIMKQQAVQLAYDAVDRARANRQAALTGNYDVNNLVTSGTPTYPSAPATDCGSVSCTPEQLAAYDTWYWLGKDIKDIARLPMGSGSIVTQASGSDTLVTVTVQWDDSPAYRKLGAASPSAAGHPSIANFVVTTLL
ncbi:type IV pilus modification protein PilV [Variovorax sp. PBL-E5]|uniref:type IV pilus modification protein PilV n=1 Tax=Variovorax sp. PBL-E5 TaxID=434014 RepID=UPI0013178817|nr:type IV pilus modification protein PilV [Variovorax sp. PBL-E5]VTU22810.1 type IV pilus modification protein PilV [Variovorax sp. PBL-E5]